MTAKWYGAACLGYNLTLAGEVIVAVVLAGWRSRMPKPTNPTNAMNTLLASV